MTSPAKVSKRVTGKARFGNTIKEIIQAECRRRKTGKYIVMHHVIRVLNSMRKPNDPCVYGTKGRMETMTSPANCTICGQQANPDGQLQCECHTRTGTTCPDCVKLLEKIGELSTRLESERQERIAAMVQAEGARKDAEMLARLIEELVLKHRAKNSCESCKHFDGGHGGANCIRCKRISQDRFEPAPADGAGRNS